MVAVSYGPSTLDEKSEVGPCLLVVGLLFGSLKSQGGTSHGLASRAPVPRGKGRSASGSSASWLSDLDQACLGEYRTYSTGVL